TTFMWGRRIVPRENSRSTSGNAQSIWLKSTKKGQKFSNSSIQPNQTLQPSHDRRGIQSTGTLQPSWPQPARLLAQRGGCGVRDYADGRQPVCARSGCGEEAED